MSIRSELKKTSSGIIDYFGYPLTLTRVSGQTYDPSTGRNTETLTTFTVSAVLTHFIDDEVNGITILSSDMKITIKAGVVVPQVNDRISGHGREMRIVEVMSLAPNDTEDMFYMCRLRS